MAKRASRATAREARFGGGQGPKETLTAREQGERAAFLIACRAKRDNGQRALALVGQIFVASGRQGRLEREKGA
ncbi:hypothetical protein ACLI4R_11495 [Natrialbaceae archaeon A-chndr2]